MLDGFHAPTNVLFVMTTNYVEDLDEALLRPGRIDYKLPRSPAYGDRFRVADDSSRDHSAAASLYNSASWGFSDGNLSLTVRLGKSPKIRNTTVEPFPHSEPHQK